MIDPHPDMTLADISFQTHLNSSEIGTIISDFIQHINELNVQTLNIGDYKFHAIYYEDTYIPDVNKCKVNNSIYFLTPKALYVREFGVSQILALYRFKGLLHSLHDLHELEIRKQCNEYRPFVIFKQLKDTK